MISATKAGGAACGSPTARPRTRPPAGCPLQQLVQPGEGMELQQRFETIAHGDPRGAQANTPPPMTRATARCREEHKRLYRRTAPLPVKRAAGRLSRPAGRPAREIARRDKQAAHPSVGPRGSQREGRDTARRSLSNGLAVQVDVEAVALVVLADPKADGGIDDLEQDEAHDGVIDDGDGDADQLGQDLAGIAVDPAHRLPWRRSRPWWRTRRSASRR